MNRAPGPWKSFQGNPQESPGHWIRGGTDGEYFWVAKHVWREDDAALIAAAPDLLRGAKMALDEKNNWDIVKPLLEAAIAKAET